MRKIRFALVVVLVGAVVGSVAGGPVRADPGARAAPVIGEYARDGFRPYAMPTADLPYHDTPLAPRVDAGPHDAQGVRMFVYNGVTYDHPVAQAQWGLSNLRTYLATGDPFFLDRAVAQAQRNLERRVTSRDAWWFPYAFDFPRCTQLPVVRAPWYSAMSQGQLLSLFVRLHQVTGAPKWRTAADLTFASLLRTPESGVPWVSWVDDAGALWLEEYPLTPGVTGERVLNGHVFALYGVYDYWRLTADPLAVALVDGAATTLRRHVPTTFRVPGWISRYSVGCPASYASYHPVHTAQLLKTYEMTRSPVFAQLADLLREDYPPPQVAGTVVFTAGTHTGYRFNSAGAVVAQRSLTLSRTSQASADQRIRVTGRAVHYRIVDGALAGYLVSEAPGERALSGMVAAHAYRPERTLVFGPGTYPGYRYDAAWKVVASRSFTFPRASAAPFDVSAWVNGRLSYRITAGAYAGFWVPAVAGLTPAPA